MRVLVRPDLIARVPQYTQETFVRTPILPNDISKIFVKCDDFKSAIAESYKNDSSAKEAINAAKEFILATGARSSKSAKKSAEAFIYHLRRMGK
ncbi:MAG: hypothetical protein IJ003_06400 [Candidatus Gastranaerophilales bacterium]|nr:hypothetical protein [Candidatus Gastranaerophilales bacterium]